MCNRYYFLKLFSLFCISSRKSLVDNRLITNSNYQNYIKMKKISIWLHRSLGLAVGLVFSLLCLTGAMMVFEDEIRELTRPELYFIQPTAQKERLTTTELAQKLNAELSKQATPDVVTSITIPQDTERNYIITTHHGSKMLYVDPYTAQIRGERAKREGLFLEIMRLHRWLLDDSCSWGKAITGYSTLAFLIILITGAIIWIPKSRKALKASLKVKPNASSYRLNLDLHRALGIYTLLPLLMLCITGLTWSFPWWRSGLYMVLNIESPENTKKNKSGSDDARPLPTIDYSSWSIAQKKLIDRYPNYRTLSISDGSAEVTKQQLIGNPRASDKLEFDTNGDITKITPYGEQPAAQRARGWIYAIHVGSWGGWFSKLLTFIVALIGASLPWTGLLIYLKKRKMRKK